jgi:hypothetical protein
VEFECPYLGTTVELTNERERHIRRRHPPFWLAYSSRIASVIADPDMVLSAPFEGDEIVFVRWDEELDGGPYALVVVLTDREYRTAVRPESARLRFWIVTVYPAEVISDWNIEWEKHYISNTIPSAISSTWMLFLLERAKSTGKLNRECSFGSRRRRTRYWEYRF